MKKLLIFAAAIFLLPFLSVKGNPSANPEESQVPSRSANANSQAVYKPEYISPTPGKFPIIASSPVSDGRKPTRFDYFILSDCGFNAAMTIFNTAQYLPLMSEIKDLDLTLLPILDNYTPLMARDTIEYIREYMNANDIPYSMIGGYRVKDEPAYRNMKDISDLHAAIKQADPDVMPFVNLAAQPNKDFKPNAPQRSYSVDSTARRNMSAYFNHFYESVHPDVWSYDYYPFVYHSQGDTLVVNYADFYYNLQLFARMSKGKGIPFWAYCQATNVRFIKIGEPNYTEHPEATEANLRYEAFNALAFGAKAITYWRYSDREDAPHPDTAGTSYEHYISSLTDKYGRQRRAWRAAEKVNKEILRHENLFMNTELLSYSLLGDTAALLGKEHYVRPTYGADIPEYDGHISIRKSSGPGFLVSSLKEGEHFVTFIVNQSPTDSTTFIMSHPVDLVKILMVENEHADSLHGLISSVSNPIFHESGPIMKPNFPLDPFEPAYKSSMPWYVRLAPAGYMIIEYDYISPENTSGKNGDNEQNAGPKMVATLKDNV